MYSNIYLKQNPDRATELIQYNHLICTAAQTFVWDNIYNYDREFRMHLQNYPGRSWGVILQQAWSVCLKDKHYGNNGSSGYSNGKGYVKKKKEICQRFNRGQCTAGHSCHYDHWCMGCGKFGHGLHICRNKGNMQSHLVIYYRHNCTLSN